MRNYWIYFISSLLSLIGSNFLMFTQGWYLLELTSEKTSVGITWSIYFLPSLLFLPIIGKILDLLNLKKNILSFEFAKLSILLLFSFILKNYPSVTFAYMLSAVYGIAFALYYPSVYVVIKNLVPQNQQTKYSHMFEVSLQLSNILAAFVSGYIYQTLGFTNTLILSAVFIGVGLISTSLLLKINQDNKNVTFKKILSGYADVAKVFKNSSSNLDRHKFLFGALHQLPQAIILVSNVPLILYVYDVMKKGPKEFGWIDAVFGVAALVSSLFWTKYHHYSERKSVYIGVGIAASLFIATMGLVKPSGIFPYIWIGIYGYFLISSKIIARAAIVKMVSREQMGLFSSLFQSIGYSMMMVLFVSMSALSKTLPVSGLYLFLGLGMLIYSLLMVKLYRPLQT